MNKICFKCGHKVSEHYSSYLEFNILDRCAECCILDRCAECCRYRQNGSNFWRHTVMDNLEYLEMKSE